ncbi:DUF4397 domain-containing protein [Aeromonas fluvialis]|uniref:DUF4397 domain-containing protein n=1 Tax=Aeromonas fluvialis TaxID=591962 RepID=UPI0005A9B4C3|nr:DUF4397 domain-containing protein [Aeromonas fluvialis]
MKWIQRLAAIAMGLTLAACGGSDSSSSSDNTNTNTNTAIRISHLAPDAPKVDVKVNGSTFLTDVDFGSSSGLKPVKAGSYSIAVDAILPGSTATVIGPVTLELKSDTQYDVLAIGKLTGSGDTQFGPLVLERPNMAPAASDIRVQVIHAAPGAPAVDIHVTAPGAALSSPTLANIPFKTYSDPITLPAGDYQVRLTLPGTVTVVYDSGTLPLAGGSDLLVAAIDNLGAGPSPVQLLAISSSGASAILSADEQAKLRVVHAVADAPAVDIWVNGTAPTAAPLQGLAFKSNTSYLTLAATTYDFAVTPTGATSPQVINASGVALQAGALYSLFAVGQLVTPSGETIDPLLLTDTGRSVATEAKLRVLHAAPTAPAVDVYLTTDTDISGASAALSAVPFKGFSDYLAIAAGDYYVTITAAGDKNPVIGPLPVNLTNGQLLTAAALSDSVGGVDPALLILNDANN